MGSERIQPRIERLLAQVKDAAGSGNWGAAADLALARDRAVLRVVSTRWADCRASNSRGIAWSSR
jgi:hypothetical protein